MPFYVIEKEEQIDMIPDFDSCYVHVVQSSPFYHPAISDVSLVYVRPPNDKGYIFCIKHNESLSLKWQKIKKFLSEKKLYALNAKNTKYYLGGNINDVMFNYMNINGNNDKDFRSLEPKAMNYMYSKFGNLSNVNELVPISKHYEYLEKVYDEMKDYIYDNTDFDINKTNIFYKIEREGIKLDKNSFIRYFGNLNNPEFNIRKGIIYTSFNLYNYTERPTNHFNGINFTALDKDNGERVCFIPKNDYFMEVDFNAYHPQLLADLVDYEFDMTKNIYEQIGQLIGVKDISKVKLEVFRNLYGGIQDKYSNLPFFRDVVEFTKSMREFFNTSGYITAPSGKKFRSKNLAGSSSSKLLNYYIQNLETKKNVEQLLNIFKYFRPLTSRIVMYNYDSFLIDVKKEEKEEIDLILRKLKYRFRIKTGIDYDDLN